MFLPKSTKIYCLVDCDSFFASCELIRRPDLVGKPVCVSRDKDIVLAATYEAKKYGVRTGTASRDARRILGQKGVFIEPDFGWYGIISDRLITFLKEFTNSVQVFSIDEMFCDITGMAEQYGLTLEQFAYYLKLKIKKTIGIPTSIGVARTKLLAKLFSDLNKPFGEYVGVDDEVVDPLLTRLPVDKLCFIGHARAEKMHMHTPTLYDFKYADQGLVKKMLGSDGIKLRMELNHRDVLSFSHEGKPKSIMRTRSFHPNFTNNRAWLRSHLMYNLERAYGELLKWGLASSYIRVRLRDQDFRSHSQAIDLPHPISDKDQIIGYLKDLFEKGYKPWIQYRTTGVIFGNLHDAQFQQTDDLFTYAAKRSHAKIHETIDNLNRKYGKDIVLSGIRHELGVVKNKSALDNMIAFEAR